MNVFWIESVFLSITSFCLLFSTSTGSECKENNVKPDDESKDSVEMNEFLDKLEIYTGLNESEPHSITMNNICSATECFVNPNGTAIWEARLSLYNHHMMTSIDGNDEDELKQTLDGCLCFSANTTDYGDCMKKVRTKMIDDLDNILIAEFKKLVEADGCASFPENCKV